MGGVCAINVFIVSEVLCDLCESGSGNRVECPTLADERGKGTGDGERRPLATPNG